MKRLKSCQMQDGVPPRERGLNQKTSDKNRITLGVSPMGLKRETYHQGYELEGGTWESKLQMKVPLRL